jgi:hypothetical protein
MTDALEFKGFGKIPRLFRDVVITQKLAGQTGAVGILTEREPGYDDPRVTHVHPGGLALGVYAQSRKRIITPQTDNHGFAAWVQEHAELLATNLGPGLHFGEWWGSGIKSGEGLTGGDKRFSLFNTKRWSDKCWCDIPGLSVVPVLYEGPFSEQVLIDVLTYLAEGGSVACPGFMQPEGIIVYHKAANSLFKITLDNDGVPKSQVVEEQALLSEQGAEPLLEVQLELPFENVPQIEWVPDSFERFRIH